MKSKVLVILFQLFCIVNVFSQIPNGAKKTIHIRVVEEYRYGISKFQAVLLPDSSRISSLLMTNGSMLELAYGHFTLGATVLSDYHKYGGSRKFDLDLGYEFYISNNQTIHPFVGCEFNENGAGLTAGTKLNKNFDFFENMSLGLFLGFRYSQSRDIISFNSNEFFNSDYFSASFGMFLMIYDYKRPKIIRDW